MKSLIAMVVTLCSFSVANAALEYHCSFANTGGAKDMKWIVFAMERRAGKEREVYFQNKVDQVVQSGETITVGSELSFQYIGWYCKFLERKDHPVAEPPVPAND